MRSASAFVVDRTDELGRILEAGIVRIDLDHRQQRGERHLERQQVAELLLDHVADHALGLRAEHVERIGLVRLVRGALQRQQADLRAVAVADDQLVLLRRRGASACAAIADVARAGLPRSSARRASAARCRPRATTIRMRQSPSVATSIALIVCRRFSACSNATFASDSNTSLVTSRPSRHAVGLRRSACRSSSRCRGTPAGSA